MKNTMGATLLISGCCIGAGMLGLPVVSALAGFIPSSLAMLVCYLFTTASGLLLLETTLWFDKKVHLISIFEFALGKFGKFITWFLCLFLFYCLFVAFLDGGGQLFAELLGSCFHSSFSKAAGIIACLTFVVGVSIAGTRVVDGFNRFLLLGLVSSFIVLVVVGFSQIDLTHLSHKNLSATVGTIPILLICFGYQNIVPNIAYYLDKNVNKIRFAILVGNFIPLLIYFLWNFVILGILPTENQAGPMQSDTVVDLLQHASKTLPVLAYVKAFSFFAILTTFLPCAISFIDFVKDGLTSYFIRNKNFLSITPVAFAIVFIPPGLFALLNPHLFLKALGFAGGFIDVLLFGVLPALTVLIGRYVKNVASEYQMIGGKLTPFIILIFSVVVLAIRLT